jgi:hypothetical protein
MSFPAIGTLRKCVECSIEDFRLLLFSATLDQNRDAVLTFPALHKVFHPTDSGVHTPIIVFPSNCKFALPAGCALAL